jgi:hypothetical protein
MLLERSQQSFDYLYPFRDFGEDKLISKGFCYKNNTLPMVPDRLPYCFGGVVLLAIG